MTIEYRANHELKLRLMSFSGRVSQADCFGCAEAMRRLTRELFSYGSVLTFSADVDMSGLTTDGLLEMEEAMAGAAEDLGGVGRLRVAAIVEGNLSVLRELRLWREVVRPTSAFTYESKTFDTLQEGLDWLEAPACADAAIQSRVGFAAI
ncbi:MAG: hypothetical protein AAFX09_12280 [Pseudomonadota bacterium]